MNKDVYIYSQMGTYWVLKNYNTTKLHPSWLNNKISNSPKFGGWKFKGLGVGEGGG